MMLHRLTERRTQTELIGSPERQDAERAGPLARPSQKAAEEPVRRTALGPQPTAFVIPAEAAGPGARHQRADEESLGVCPRGRRLFKESKNSSLRSE